MSFAVPEHRWGLLVGGLASVVLGVIVLFNIVTATFTLLGVLVGVQTLVDGFTLMFLGRPHVREVPARSTNAGVSSGQR